MYRQRRTQNVMRMQARTLDRIQIRIRRHEMCTRYCRCRHGGGCITRDAGREWVAEVCEVVVVVFVRVRSGVEVGVRVRVRVVWVRVGMRKDVGGDGGGWSLWGGTLPVGLVHCTGNSRPRSRQNHWGRSIDTHTQKAQTLIQSWGRRSGMGKCTTSTARVCI